MPELWRDGRPHDTDFKYTNWTESRNMVERYKTYEQSLSASTTKDGYSGWVAWNHTYAKSVTERVSIVIGEGYTSSTTSTKAWNYTTRDGIYSPVRTSVSQEGGDEKSEEPYDKGGPIQVYTATQESTQYQDYIEKTVSETITHTVTKSYVSNTNEEGKNTSSLVTNTCSGGVSTSMEMVFTDKTRESYVTGMLPHRHYRERFWYVRVGADQVSLKVKENLQDSEWVGFQEAFDVTYGTGGLEIAGTRDAINQQPDPANADDFCGWQSTTASDQDIYWAGGVGYTTYKVTSHWQVPKYESFAIQTYGAVEESDYAPQTISSITESVEETQANSLGEATTINREGVQQTTFEWDLRVPKSDKASFNEVDANGDLIGDPKASAVKTGADWYGNANGYTLANVSVSAFGHVHEMLGGDPDTDKMTATFETTHPAPAFNSSATSRYENIYPETDGSPERRGTFWHSIQEGITPEVSFRSDEDGTDFRGGVHRYEWRCYSHSTLAFPAYQDIYGIGTNAPMFGEIEEGQGFITANWKSVLANTAFQKSILYSHATVIGGQVKTILDRREEPDYFTTMTNLNMWTGMTRVSMDQSDYSATSWDEVGFDTFETTKMDENDVEITITASNITRATPQTFEGIYDPSEVGDYVVHSFFGRHTIDKIGGEFQDGDPRSYTFVNIADGTRRLNIAQTIIDGADEEYSTYVLGPNETKEFQGVKVTHFRVDERWKVSALRRKFGDGTVVDGTAYFQSINQEQEPTP